MYRDNPQASKYIPSKRITLLPEYNGTYSTTTNNQMRFHIPRNVGFVDTNDLVMRMNVKINGSVSNWLRFNPRCNGHALFRSMRVTDGMNSCVLDDNTAYNSLASIMEKFSENDTIRNKKTLTQGLQNPAGLTSNYNLFYQPEGNWVTETVTANSSPKDLQIELPFTYSNLLHSGKVLPVVAFNGINIQANIDELNRVLQPASDICSSLASNTVYAESVTAKTGGTSDEKTAIGDTFTMVVKKTGASAGNLNVEHGNDCFFKIHDELMIKDATNEESLGFITQMKNDGTGQLEITYIPNRANGTKITNSFAAGSNLFYNVVRRVEGFTGDGTNLPSSISLTAPSLSVSNVKLVASQISPPPDWVKSLTSQINSSEGFGFNYKQYINVRNTLPANNGMLQQMIPQNYTAVYSMLSLPCDNAKYSVLTDDPWEPAVDGQKEYQMVHGGQNITNRPVKIERYALSPSKNDPLHMNELIKGLENCDIPVRNLVDLPNRFAIGRAFSRIPAVADLSNGDLSMKVLYLGATTTKMWDNFLCINALVSIKNENIVVSR